jgi:membrane-bound lytic murein transglycosylase B
MQFLPSTWRRYGHGGDIQATGDAILAAARLLRANGAPADMAGALYADAQIKPVSSKKANRSKVGNTLFGVG